MIVVAISTKSTAVHEFVKILFFLFSSSERNQSFNSIYPKTNDKPNYTMSPSYQTIIPPANAPKEERSSTPVPMMKKVGIAAMVGTALVAGYSYGASTNPAVIDIATTTTAAANLVHGSVRNGDAGLNHCSILGLTTEKACNEHKGCHWYAHCPSKVGCCDTPI